MTDLDREEFKRKYPNLARELEEEAGEVQIESVQRSDKFQGLSLIHI